MHEEIRDDYYHYHLLNGKLNDYQDEPAARLIMKPVKILTTYEEEVNNWDYSVDVHCIDGEVMRHDGPAVIVYFTSGKIRECIWLNDKNDISMGSDFKINYVKHYDLDGREINPTIYTKINSTQCVVSCGCVMDIAEVLKTKFECPGCRRIIKFKSTHFDIYEIIKGI